PGPKREKALHVGDTKAVQPLIALDQLERIGRPALCIMRHGVEMPGKHQPLLARSCSAAADARRQVDLVGAVRQWLDGAFEAAIPQPLGQLFGSRAVAAIQRRIGAADGIGGNQFRQHVAPLQWLSHDCRPCLSMRTGMVPLYLHLPASSAWGAGASEIIGLASTTMGAIKPDAGYVLTRMVACICMLENRACKHIRRGDDDG